MDDIQSRIEAAKIAQQMNQGGGLPQVPGQNQTVEVGPAPGPVNVSSNIQCAQCGHFHPPVADGNCPLQKQKTESGVMIDTDPFLARMRDIVISQIQMRNVKNPEKFFAHLTVELTKIMEAYKE